MAIFHLSIKTVSRSAGHSATAAAAYRSGVKITDERTGEIHDYTKRKGVALTEMIFPERAVETDREKLWNLAERAEKRKNSTVAREYEIALPHELSRSEKIKLAREYGAWLADRFGVAVDMAIHEPGKGGDNRNWHAHILTTTRVYEADGSLGAKTRELDDKKSGAVLEVRQEWERQANQSLKKNSVAYAVVDGPPQISCKSHKERGLETLPTAHMGKPQTWIERKSGGKISTTVGRINRLIMEANRELIEAQKRIKMWLGMVETVVSEVVSPSLEVPASPPPAKKQPAEMSNAEKLGEQIERIEKKIKEDTSAVGYEYGDARERLCKRGIGRDCKTAQERDELIRAEVDSEVKRGRLAQIALLKKAIEENGWVPFGAKPRGLEDLCTQLAEEDARKAQEAARMRQEAVERTKQQEHQQAAEKAAVEALKPKIPDRGWSR